MRQVTEVDIEFLIQLCLNMRKQDAMEILNLLPHDNLYKLAYEANHMITNDGYGRLAWHRGRPCALAALTSTRPGVWDAWMFGSDDFKHGAFPLLGWFRRQAAAIIDEGNGHRLQADCRVGHDEAHKLLRGLGALPEGEPMQGFGKDGSAYQRYSWVVGINSEVLKPGFTRAA